MIRTALRRKKTRQAVFLADNPVGFVLRRDPGRSIDYDKYEYIGSFNPDVSRETISKHLNETRQIALI